MSADATALAKPLAVAVNAVQDCYRIRLGDTIMELRLARAAEIGFETCKLQNEYLAVLLIAATGGYGADVVERRPLQCWKPARPPSMWCTTTVG